MPLGRSYRIRKGSKMRNRFHAHRLTTSTRGYLRRSGFYGRYNKPAMIKRLSNLAGAVERKHLDTTVGSTAIVQAGTIFGSLNLIAQNASETGRIGRKVVMTEIGIRGIIHMPSASSMTVNGDQVRLMVVLDKQCNGAVFTVDDVLEPATWEGFNNLENTNRFVTLAKLDISMNALAGMGNGTTNVTTEQHKPFFFWIKRRIPIQFDGATGAITEIRSNNVAILAVSAMADTTVTLSYVARIRFIG